MRCEKDLKQAWMSAFDLKERSQTSVDEWMRVAERDGQPVFVPARKKLLVVELVAHHAA